MQIERYNKAKAEEKSGIECSPVVIFKQAIENCKPLLLTTRVVKGGVAYQVGRIDVRLLVRKDHHLCTQDIAIGVPVSSSLSPLVYSNC